MILDAFVIAVSRSGIRVHRAGCSRVRDCRTTAPMSDLELLADATIATCCKPVGARPSITCAAEWWLGSDRSVLERAAGEDVRCGGTGRTR
jgi:hypothetical protein